MEPVCPNPTYYLIREDGTITSEIYGRPPISEIFPVSFEYKNICLLESRSLVSIPSKLSKWMRINDSGITITIVMDGEPAPSCKENRWFKERGMDNIFGKIILVALSLNKPPKTDYFIPVGEATEIARKTLKKRNRTMSDCMVHSRLRMEYSRENRSFSRSVGEFVTRKKRSKRSPDDSPSVPYTKKCVVCLKTRNSQGKICSCSCGREYYCGIKCQRKHWENHKFVHRNVFLQV